MTRNKFDIDEELENEFNIHHFRRLLGYLKPYRTMIAVTVLLMLASSIATLSGPYLIKRAIDNQIPAKDIDGLIRLSLIYLAALALSYFCLKFRIRTMSFIGHSIIQDIRADLFKHLQKLPFAYYDSRPHGKILVRVINYVNSLSDLLSNGLINLITDAFSLMVIIIFMLVIDVRLTLICLTGLPVLCTAVVVIKNAQRQASQWVSRKQSNLNAYIHESICGIKVTQSFAREDENLAIFKDLCLIYRQAWMHYVKIIFLLWPIVDNISTIGACILYSVGIHWLHQGVTVGVLVAFISYIWRFWAPITNISNFYNSIITATTYLERIFETMDEKPIVADLPNAVVMPLIQGKVEFKNVCFAYEEGEPVLKNVSFKVNPGDTIALVGPTGAGKTSIINLISRFYNLNDGVILIDGMDISRVTLASLRKQMGVMLQDTFIFSGTIMDNIRYGRLGARDEEVIAAAQAIKAHDFIKELPDGYYTEVNERGSRLSAGQRQLISFARALLADPKILILDEATSSIDTQTERLLQQGLGKLLQGRTSFIIAHRLSTIKNADQIMVIDRGQIIEQGTHVELLAKKGAYFKLYTAQTAFLEAI